MLDDEWLGIFRAAAEDEPAASDEAGNDRDAITEEVVTVQGERTHGGVVVGRDDGSQVVVRNEVFASLRPGDRVVLFTGASGRPQLHHPGWFLAAGGGAGSAGDAPHAGRRATYGDMVEFAVHRLAGPADGEDGLVGEVLGVPAILPRALLRGPEAVAGCPLAHRVGRVVRAVVVDPIARPVVLRAAPSDGKEGERKRPRGTFLLALHTLARHLPTFPVRVVAVEPRVQVDVLGRRFTLAPEQVAWTTDAGATAGLQPDDAVEASCCVDLRTGSVDVSLKRLDTGEWDALLAEFPCGSVVPYARIGRTGLMGITVSIPHGRWAITGLVPWGELTSGNDPFEIPPAADPIAVEVIGHDRGRRLVVVSRARCAPSPFASRRPSVGQILPAREVPVSADCSLLYWDAGHAVPMARRQHALPGGGWCWVTVAACDPDRQTIELREPAMQCPGEVVERPDGVRCVRLQGGVELPLGRADALPSQAGVLVGLRDVRWGTPLPQVSLRLTSSHDGLVPGAYAMGEITRATSDRMTVDIGACAASLPPGHAPRGGGRPSAEWVGRRIPVKVLSRTVSAMGEPDVVVSHRAVVDEHRLLGTRRALARLRPGMVVQGTVATVLDSGVSVDLGGVQGTLPPAVAAPDESEPSGPRPGDPIRVVVGSVRGPADVQLMPYDGDDPGEPAASAGSDVLDGVVRAIVDAGALVDAGPVEGILPMEEFAPVGRVQPIPFLLPGDHVRVRVAGILQGAVRFSRDREGTDGRLPAGVVRPRRVAADALQLSPDLRAATVCERRDGEALVDVGGVEARLLDAPDSLPPGHGVCVRVVDAGPELERPVVALVRSSPFGTLPMRGEICRGRVTRVTPVAADVDLGGVPGMLHADRVGGRPVENLAETMAVGDDVTVEVIEVLPLGGRVSLRLSRPDDDEPFDVLRARVERQAASYGSGQVVACRIVLVRPSSVIVEVEPGLFGVVRCRTRSGADLSTPVELQVVRFDPRALRMELKPVGDDAAARFEIVGPNDPMRVIPAETVADGGGPAGVVAGANGTPSALSATATENVEAWFREGSTNLSVLSSRFAVKKATLQPLAARVLDGRVVEWTDPLFVDEVRAVLAALVADAGERGSDAPAVPPHPPDPPPAEDDDLDDTEWDDDEDEASPRPAPPAAEVDAALDAWLRGAGSGAAVAATLEDAGYLETASLVAAADPRAGGPERRWSPTPGWRVLDVLASLTHDAASARSGEPEAHAGPSAGAATLEAALRATAVSPGEVLCYEALARALPVHWVLDHAEALESWLREWTVGQSDDWKIGLTLLRARAAERAGRLVEAYHLVNEAFRRCEDQGLREERRRLVQAQRSSLQGRACFFDCWDRDFTLPPREGGFSLVVPVVDRTSGERLALKHHLLKDCPADEMASRLELLEREIGLLERLPPHPFVVAFRGRLDRGCFLLEWLDGESLQEALRSWDDDVARWWDARRVLALAHGIASALASVNAALPQGFVHNDLAPRNVMVSRSGRDPWWARLIDVGLAVAPGMYSTSPIHEVAVRLDEHYRAPEVRRGQPPTPQSEMFSLASIAVDLLCGPHPDPEALLDPHGPWTMRLERAAARLAAEGGGGAAAAVLKQMAAQRAAERPAGWELVERRLGA